MNDDIKPKQRSTKALTSELMTLLKDALKQGVFLIDGKELMKRLSFKCGNVMTLLSADDRMTKIKEALSWEVVWQDVGTKSKRVYLIHQYKPEGKFWKQCREAIKEGSPKVWANARKFIPETLIEHVLTEMHKAKGSAYPVAKACKEVGCSLSYFYDHLKHGEKFESYLNAAKLIITKRTDNGRLLFVKDPEAEARR